MLCIVSTCRWCQRRRVSERREQLARRWTSVVKNLVNTSEKDLQHVLGIERALFMVIGCEIHDILSICNIRMCPPSGNQRRTDSDSILLFKVVIQSPQGGSGVLIRANLYKLDTKHSVRNLASFQALGRVDDDTGESIVVGWFRGHRQHNGRDISHITYLQHHP
jgi:hypothetical protein